MDKRDDVDDDDGRRRKYRQIEPGGPGCWILLLCVVKKASSHIFLPIFYILNVTMSRNFNFISNPKSYMNIVAAMLLQNQPTTILVQSKIFLCGIMSCALCASLTAYNFSTLFFEYYDILFWREYFYKNFRLKISFLSLLFLRIAFV